MKPNLFKNLVSLIAFTILIIGTAFSIKTSVSAEELTDITEKINETVEIKKDDEGEETTPHNHSFVDEVIHEGSCTEDTVVRHICNCGYSYDETIPTQGHDYKLISEEYDDDSIIKTYKCCKCDDNYSETVSAIVARVYICAKSSASPLGHTWIYIENLSDHNLKVGLYDLPVGEGVSLGTFGVTRTDGTGLYYNVESYCANKYGIGRTIYMSEDVTEAELDKVSKKILKSNHWNPFTNCTGFSFGVWNTVSDKKLVPMLIPVLGRFEMILHNHDANIEMFYPSESEVYKQKKNNDKAYLTAVSQGTISHGI